MAFDSHSLSKKGLHLKVAGEVARRLVHVQCKSKEASIRMVAEGSKTLRQMASKPCQYLPHLLKHGFALTAMSSVLSSVFAICLHALMIVPKLSKGILACQTILQPIKRCVSTRCKSPSLAMPI